MTDGRFPSSGSRRARARRCTRTDHRGCAPGRGPAPGRGSCPGCRSRHGQRSSRGVRRRRRCGGRRGLTRCPGRSPRRGRSHGERRRRRTRQRLRRCRRRHNNDQPIRAAGVEHPATLAHCARHVRQWVVARRGSGEDHKRADHHVTVRKHKVVVILRDQAQSVAALQRRALTIRRAKGDPVAAHRSGAYELLLNRISGKRQRHCTAPQGKECRIVGNVVTSADDIRTVLEESHRNRGRTALRPKHQPNVDHGLTGWNRWSCGRRSGPGRCRGDGRCRRTCACRRARTGGGMRGAGSSRGRCRPGRSTSRCRRRPLHNHDHSIARTSRQRFAVRRLRRRLVKQRIGTWKRSRKHDKRADDQTTVRQDGTCRAPS